MMLEAGEGWKGTDGAWVAFPDPSDGREGEVGGGRREWEGGQRAVMGSKTPSPFLLDKTGWQNLEY